MIQIPIYRAKKIDSNKYIEGYYLIMGSKHCIYENKLQTEVVCIDPTTLSIHFPNMIDKNGKKIFASLSEDGKGGDAFGVDGDYWWLGFINSTFKMFDNDDYQDQNDRVEFKYLGVIGVHQ